MGGTYHDLRVWQEAMELTLKIYRMTRKFPAQEMYGLSAQLRRAAVSIASNIAEGKGRSSDKELLQFLSHARGSLYEVQTQLQIAKSLVYMTETDHQCGSAGGRRRKDVEWNDRKVQADDPEVSSLKPRA
jgi:four helix bundle protein